MSRASHLASENNLIANLRGPRQTNLAAEQCVLSYFAGVANLYKIVDLRPGTYTITAWQEKLGTQTQKVTVGAGEAKTLDFAFKQ